MQSNHDEKFGDAHEFASSEIRYRLTSTDYTRGKRRIDRYSITLSPVERHGAEDIAFEQGNIHRIILEINRSFRWPSRGEAILAKRDANTFFPSLAIISLASKVKTEAQLGRSVGFISEFRECRAGCDNKSLVSTEAGRFGNTKEDRQQRTWDGKSIASASQASHLLLDHTRYLPTFRINITLDSRHFFHHRYKAEINYASRSFFPTSPTCVVQPRTYTLSIFTTASSILLASIRLASRSS